MSTVMSFVGMKFEQLSAGFPLGKNICTKGGGEKFQRPVVA